VSGIPLVDLKAQHKQIAEEVQRGFSRVLENTSFILGKEVAEFEEQYARFVGVKHCIGVANGTDALELLVRAAAATSSGPRSMPSRRSSRPISACATASAWRTAPTR